MKFISVTCGRFIEGLSVLPNIDISWMQEDRKYWDIRFSWLFWYITIGEIKKRLQYHGYYN